MNDCGVWLGGCPVGGPPPTTPARAPVSAPGCRVFCSVEWARCLSLPLPSPLTFIDASSRATSSNTLSWAAPSGAPSTRSSRAEARAAASACGRARLLTSESSRPMVCVCVCVCVRGWAGGACVRKGGGACPAAGGPRAEKWRSDEERRPGECGRGLLSSPVLSCCPGAPRRLSQARATCYNKALK